MLMMVMLVYWRLDGAGPMSVVTTIIYLLQLTFHQHPCFGVKNFLQPRVQTCPVVWERMPSERIMEWQSVCSVSIKITGASLSVKASPRQSWPVPDLDQPSFPAEPSPAIFQAGGRPGCCLGSCLTSHSDQRINLSTIYCNITSHPPFIFYPYINIFQNIFKYECLGAHFEPS